jgi:uncharacterized protein YecA (UPF0149 family)
MAFIKSVMSFFSPEQEKRPVHNVGRTDSCWCGSGRKYKHCHLHEDQKKLKNYSVDCLNG